MAEQMNTRPLFSILTLVLLLVTACSSSYTGHPGQLSSPNGKVTFQLELNEDGQANYLVFMEELVVVDTSRLAHFDFKNQPSLDKNLELTDWTITSYNDNWEMPWGEKRQVENQYNEMKAELTEMESGRRLNLWVRAYNDGVAFRYDIPRWKDVDSLIIMDEHTAFDLTEDYTAFWIPGDWDIYEHTYKTTLLSGIDATLYRDDPNLAQTYIPENAVNTPVTLRSETNGLHLSFHEANLTDYAGMTLKADTAGLGFVSELVGSDRTGYKVKRALPFVTPWRSIQISEDAKGLLESDLIVNLNEPNKLGDISWFTPMKYVGIWWEMHLGKSTWSYNEKNHGATTENAKAYIDFAAENNIGGVLVEGWNTGWGGYLSEGDREGGFDFVTSYPDYDLPEVVEYARSKGVQIIMHNETNGAPRTYEAHLDTAYALMQQLGIHSVKTGYVGKIIPEGEYHHGQWMVNHYRKVLEIGAAHQVAINAHEPIKATGIRRTMPNAISREGLRGQEFNAWASDGGNPPEHLPIVAFTRMLAGPIDFTPGIFNIKLDPYKPNNQVNTTLAQQLALYVVINSPVQMAADLIENYEGQPAFQFIRDVGVNWEQTKVLDGEVGDFVTIAREERDSGSWFLGSITDENPRSVDIDFDFLEEGKEYQAIIYRDADDAHWMDNPTAIDIQEAVFSSNTKRSFELAPGGGLAISLKLKAD